MPAHLSPSTQVVVAGRPARRDGGPVNPAVTLSSTFVSAGEPTPGHAVYGRSDNETWQALEEALGTLEGPAQGATVFASGMAAVVAAMAPLRPGGTLVLPRHVYQITAVYAAELAERSAVRVVPVDVADTEAVVAALAAARGPGLPGGTTETDAAAAAGGTTTSGAGPGTDLLLWLESPTNPMLEVADLPSLITAAHDVGALVAVDNTFATPLVQRPLELGADLVVHSVTKYLSGHSDVLAGVVVAADPALVAAVRAHRTLHGAALGPWEAWLALRGLRTLALRVERSQASAAVLAGRLAAHPAVAEVRHPSLPADPGHARAAAQMDGFGSILAVRPRGGAAAADAVVDAVRLWLPATSLGGVESSIERRRRFATESPTVPEDLLRLSVGIEDVEDLWADLDRALRSAAAVIR